MIIKQTNLNLVYPRLANWRKSFVLAEDVLMQQFNSPTILPVPEEVQEDVPRIVVPSKNGHSILNIALSVATFTTTYDNHFTKDWDKCCTYLKERCASVYELTNSMTNGKHTFIGLITHIELDDLDQSGLEVLKNSLFHSTADKLDKLFDVGCKLTYVYKEKYYINITLENLRDFELAETPEGKRYISRERKHTISAVLDINDRYAVNYNPEYSSDKASFDEILGITDMIINHKLSALVKKGEFYLDD